MMGAGAVIQLHLFVNGTRSCNLIQKVPLLYFSINYPLLSLIGILEMRGTVLYSKLENINILAVIRVPMERRMSME